MACRRATHAGSWYTDDADELSEELDAWLEEAAATVPQSTPDHARAIIAPHAGFRYSGRCAAYAFSHIDPTKIKRVFLLGPSHHYYTRRCALSNLAAYSTPLGDVNIDTEVYAELRATGEFEEMTSQVDEAEHSMEMHLPYIYKVFGGRPFTLIPILVGSISPETEERYGRLLSRYFDDPQNLFCISSDFCHWGQRFSYTYYDKKLGPIYKSIEALDRNGMDIIETGDPASFTAYLQQYENTICGRHPIGVLLHALQHSRTKMQIRFNQYEQSSRCKTMRDSSVSYASAVAIPLRLGKTAD